MGKLIFTIAVLVVFASLAFLTARSSFAGPNGCPPGADSCFTAQHNVTGKIKCFPSTAKNDNAWTKLYDGCDDPQVVNTVVVPVIFPTDTLVVMPTPSSTPVSPIATSSVEPTVVVQPGIFPGAVPTACVQCSSPEDCVCLLVTQAVISNVFSATQAAAQATMAAKP